MTATTAALVAVAGAAGALVRHELTSRAPDALRALHVVNVLGALLAGAVAGVAAAVALGDVVVLVAVAGLGALTSFSTWMVEAHGRARSTADTAPGRPRSGDGWLTHLIVPAVAAVAAAGTGLVLGRLVVGGGA